MMSNAKLKEQIEAAKIALVHSAEAGSYADTSPASSTVKQIPRIEADHAQAHLDSVSGRPLSPTNSETPVMRQDTIPQSDFEKLEARLQDLEDQIRNQQRDLHTLLQKLRNITAKTRAVTEPKKSKGTKKWLVGAVLCMMGFGAVYYLLGTQLITGIIYQATGLVIALIDTLAGKI